MINIEGDTLQPEGGPEETEQEPTEETEREPTEETEREPTEEELERWALRVAIGSVIPDKEFWRLIDQSDDLPKKEETG